MDMDIIIIGKFNDCQTIDHLIETGNSEQIFQKAIQEMGRGQVCIILLQLTLKILMIFFSCQKFHTKYARTESVGSEILCTILLYYVLQFSNLIIFFHKMTSISYFLSEEIKVYKIVLLCDLYSKFQCIYKSYCKSCNSYIIGSFLCHH